MTLGMRLILVLAVGLSCSPQPSQGRGLQEKSLRTALASLPLDEIEGLESDLVERINPAEFAVRNPDLDVLRWALSDSGGGYITCGVWQKAAEENTAALEVLVNAAHDLDALVYSPSGRGRSRLPEGVNLYPDSGGSYGFPPPDSGVSFGFTPLMVVTACGDLNSVRMLLERGADVSRRNELGMTALLVAVWKAQDPRVVHELLDSGASPSDVAMLYGFEFGIAYFSMQGDAAPSVVRTGLSFSQKVEENAWKALVRLGERGRVDAFAAVASWVLEEGWKPSARVASELKFLDGQVRQLEVYWRLLD